jgi:GxxExxY protein
MNEEEILKIIFEEGLYIHKEIGPGMLEKVYQTCLVYRLKKRGLNVRVEVPVPIVFEEVKMDCGYRTDIVVENKVVVEVKSAEGITPIFIAQTLTQLKFLGLRYGVLINFNVEMFKYGFRRVLNGY